MGTGLDKKIGLRVKWKYGGKVSPLYRRLASLLLLPKDAHIAGVNREQGKTNKN